MNPSNEALAEILAQAGNISYSQLVVTMFLLWVVQASKGRVDEATLRTLGASLQAWMSEVERSVFDGDD